MSVRGPRDIRVVSHRAASPLLVRLHRESTYSNLEYLVEQVFRLTAMSWRTLYPSNSPVTIQYSDRNA